MQEKRKKFQDLDLFENAFRFATIGMALVSLEGQFFKVNPALCQMLGYGEQELLARTFQDLTHPEDLEIDLNLYHQSLQGKMPSYQVEKRYLHRDGHPVWGNLSVSLVRDSDGEPQFFISQIQDITLQRKLEAESKHFFELSLEPLAIVSLDGFFKKINPSFQRVLGYFQQELLDQPYLGYIHPEDQPKTLAILEKTSAGQPTHYCENRYRCRDGSYKWLAWSAMPVVEQGLCYAVARDITEDKKLKDEVQRSRDRYKNVLDSITDVFYILDHQWRFTYLNQEAEKLFQMPVEKLLHQRCWDWFPQLLHQEMYKQFNHALSQGQPAHFELETPYAGKYFEVRAYPSQEGLAVYLHDMSQRKRALEELDHFFDLSVDMLCIIDGGGYIKRMNPAWLHTLGYTKEEMRARPLKSFIHPEDFQRTVAATKQMALMGSNRMHIENRFMSKDGSYRWFECAAVPDVSQGLTYAVIRDITELRAYREHLELLVAQRTEQLTFLNAQLQMEIFERKQVEQEVLALNRDLRHRARELDAANKELEAFSYSVSHDLRAPLRSISGFSSALLEDYGDKLDAEGQDYLRRVLAAGQRMGDLIGDLLKLSQVTRHQLDLTQVNLSELAHRVVADLRSRDPERSIDVTIQPGLITQGDPGLLRIVLDNLLGNAWKFTGKQPKPEIQMGQREIKGERVYFIRDNGAGFSMNYANRLFAPFQRLHKESEFIGTGVGLATVNRIIHRHGGSIWAEAIEGEGATFFFTLKLDQD